MIPEKNFKTVFSLESSPFVSKLFDFINVLGVTQFILRLPQYLVEYLVKPENCSRRSAKLDDRRECNSSFFHLKTVFFSKLRVLNKVLGGTEFNLNVAKKQFEKLVKSKKASGGLPYSKIRETIG